MPTAVKKKGRPKKVNHYNLSREYIARVEREFLRILPQAQTDKEQAELLRHMRSKFGLRK